MPAPSSAIILVIDRLGAGYLGPYGNTWLETPGFNRLASQGLVCEQMLAASPDLDATYRHYWFGEAGGKQSIPSLARAAGCRTVLLTDDESIAHLPGGDFDDVLIFQPVPAESDCHLPACDVANTGFHWLMEYAAAQLAEWKDSPQPQLLWIHARAMNGPWDAPQELREQFADEEDPPPSATTTPPNERLADDHDPDKVLSLTHAYAGQVSVVDLGLQAILAAIDELPQRDNLLFAVTSPRGYPLGEHGRVGRCDDALYSELLHVPLLVQFPRQEGALLRTQELIQPAELFATLTEVLGGDVQPSRSLLRLVRSEDFAERPLAFAAAANQRLIRTAAWQLRVSTDEDGEKYELFAKPDDRWEFNDVANRAVDIVQQLLKLSADAEVIELPVELTSPWR